MFKIDLDDNYKVLCNDKHPIGSELFGDDFTERLKTVSPRVIRQRNNSQGPISYFLRNIKAYQNLFQAKGGAASAPSISTIPMHEATRETTATATERNHPKQNPRTLNRL